VDYSEFCIPPTLISRSWKSGFYCWIEKFKANEAIFSSISRRRLQQGRIVNAGANKCLIALKSPTKLRKKLSVHQGQMHIAAGATQ